MRKLILLTVSIATVIALTLTTLAPDTTAAPPRPTPVDCDTVGQVCRDMSQLMYDLCVASGGNLSDCAWQEALNTLNCLKNNGCGPLPKIDDQ